jgi:chromosome segregation ATPase
MTTPTPESIAEQQQRGWAQAVADVCAERDKLREEVKELRSELDNERLAKAGLLRANDSLATSARQLLVQVEHFESERNQLEVDGQVLRAQVMKLRADHEEVLRLNHDMAARFGRLAEGRERLLAQVDQLPPMGDTPAETQEALVNLWIDEHNSAKMVLEAFKLGVAEGKRQAQADRAARP